MNVGLKPNFKGDIMEDEIIHRATKIGYKVTEFKRLQKAYIELERYKDGRSRNLALEALAPDNHQLDTAIERLEKGLFEARHDLQYMLEGE